MNNNDIKKILNDIYSLDPGLREHEKQLITIIQAMAIKPETHYDSAFVATLRGQLIAELRRNQAQIISEKRSTLADLFTGRPLRYAVAGLAVIAIAVLAITSFQEKGGNSNQVALNSSNLSITNVGANAFGKLTAANMPPTGTPSQTGNGAAATPTATPTTQNMGASMAPMSAANVSTPITAGPMMPINPHNSTIIKYNYTGDPITQDQSQLNVLKKIIQPLSANQATTALEQAGFGQMNLSSFNDLSMSNVTLSQNQSFGYQFSLDLTNGTISIYQNYNEWPNGTTSPLTASDIPTDDAVIATANHFLSAHSISTANYGTPTVTHYNTMVVPLAAQSVVSSDGTATSMPMIPYYSDSEQVLYPLVINGHIVYDTNGNQIGFTVEVNVRYNRVANVYGLDTESYQSSAYDAITNTSTIITTAEKSPSYPIIYYGMNDSATNSPTPINKTATYNLGTPTMGYAQIYQSDSNGQSEQFFVPAFIFPVIGNVNSAPTQNIVVPLIKDFAQTSNNGVMIPYSGAPTPGQSSGSAAGGPITH